MTKTESGQSPNKNIAHIASGGSIVFIGRLISLCVSYLLSIVLARSLGTSEYGVFVVGFSLVTLVGSFALLGLNRGSVRFVAMYMGIEKPRNVLGVFWWSIVAVMVTGLIALIVIVSFSEPLADFLNIPEPYTNTLNLFALWVFVYVLVHQLTATVEGLKQFRYRAFFFDIGWPVARLLLSILVLYLGMQLRGVVTANIVASVLIFVLLGIVVNQILIQPNRGVAPIVSGREILAFSLPVMLFNLLNLSQNQLEVYLLTILQSPDVAGIFNVAARTSVLVVAFLEGLGIIFSPFVSDLTAKGQLDELQELMSTITRWSLMLSLPACLFLIFFADQVVGLFGDGFTAAGQVLMVLAVGQLVNAATGPVGIMLTMSGHPNVNMVNSFLTLTLSLVLGLVLIPRYGVVGAAVSSAISTSLVNMLRTIQVKRILHVWAYNWEFAKPLVSAVFASGVIYVIVDYLNHLPDLLYLFIGGLLLAIVYLICLWVLRLSPSDKFVLALFRDSLRSKMTISKGGEI